MTTTNDDDGNDHDNDTQTVFWGANESRKELAIHVLQLVHRVYACTYEIAGFRFTYTPPTWENVFVSQTHTYDSFFFFYPTVWCTVFFGECG